MDDKLTQINMLFKELNQIYEKYSQYCNLPDASVWVLYALRNNEKEFNQKMLSNLLFFKKQTINSAIKVLEKKKFIELIPFEENKKSKKVILTKNGKKYLKEHLDNIVEAEKKAADSMGDGEINQLFEIVGKYILLLRQEINKISDNKIKA